MSLMLALLACGVPTPTVVGDTASTTSPTTTTTTTTTTTAAADTADTATTDTATTDTGTPLVVVPVVPLLVQPGALLTFDWCALSPQPTGYAIVLRLIPGADPAVVIAQIRAHLELDVLDDVFIFNGAACRVSGPEFDGTVGGAALEPWEVIAGQSYIVAAGESELAGGWQVFVPDPSSVNTEVVLQTW